MARPLGKITKYSNHRCDPPYVVVQLRAASEAADVVLSHCAGTEADARQGLFELAKLKVGAVELELALLREFIASQEGR